MNKRNDKNTIAQIRANMQVVHNILNGGIECKLKDFDGLDKTKSKIVLEKLQLAA